MTAVQRNFGGHPENADAVLQSFFASLNLPQPDAARLLRHAGWMRQQWHCALFDFKLIQRVICFNRTISIPLFAYIIVSFDIERSVATLVEQNLDDADARHLMVLTKVRVFHVVQNHQNKKYRVL